MRVNDLVPSEAEHLLARSLGYHVRSQNEPYVTIDDWNKEGTIVDGCRFQPMSDQTQWEKLARIFGVKTLQTGHGWDAGILLDDIKLVQHNGGITCGDAIVRCLLKSMYPNKIPTELLKDNPL